jgi:hypothetical protein
LINAIEKMTDDDFMRLTVDRVPISRALLLESGLHLTLLLKPFLSPPGNWTGLDCVDSIGRCKACNSYMNPYNVFEERGWICTLCSMANGYDQGENNHRYLGGSGARQRLPELQSDLQFVDLSLDPAEEGEDGLPKVYPLFFAVVDVTGDAAGIEEVKAALLTVLDDLPEDRHFGLSLLDEASMYIMNWSSGRFHSVSCTDDRSTHTMASRIKLEDVLGRVGDVKRMAELLISQLEPKPAKKGEEHLHSCFYGEAVKGLLKFFLASKSEGSCDGEVGCIDVNGRMIGSRIVSFLGKVPSKGDGQILSYEETMARQEADGYYLDPMNPEMYMPNIRSQEINRATHENIDELGTSYILDRAAQEFYSGAGAAAAVTGVAMDVYLVGNQAVGGENLAIMASVSGGQFKLYDGEDVRLAEDLHSLMSDEEMIDCSLKIRTSTELQVLGNMDNGMQDDCEQSNTYHAPRISSNDICGGIMLDLKHKTGLGLSHRTPVYIQLAIRFHRIDKDGTVRRFLRIITQEFDLARSVGELFASHNVEVHLYSEFCGAMTLAGIEGRQLAAETLRSRADILSRKRDEWIKHGEFLEDESAPVEREQQNDPFLLGMELLIGAMVDEESTDKFQALTRLYHSKNRSVQDLIQILF